MSTATEIVPYREIPAVHRKRITLSQRVAKRRMTLAAKKHKNTKGEPMDFDAYPYLVDLYADPAEQLVLQTGAQTGKTEFIVCDGFAVISLGIPYQLVFPKEDMRDVFKTTRLVQLQRMVPAYKNHLKFAKNLVVWKSVEGGTLKLAFSNREDEMLSFPADAIGIDELDACHLGNITELGSRQLQSEFRMARYASTPRLPGEETIHHRYLQSDQKQWMIPCVHCGEEQPLDWFANVVREERDATTGELREAVLMDDDWSPRKGVTDIRAMCRACARPLNRHVKGRWVPGNPNSLVSGYHLNKLSSPRVEITEMWAKYTDAKNHPKKLQTFANTYLGLPYAGSGDKVTPEMLQRCAIAPRIEPNRVIGVERERCTMGVDVGPAFLDVRISIPKNGGMRIAVYIGKVKSFTDVLALVQAYRVITCVMDAEPEARKSMDAQEQMKRLGCLGIRCHERKLEKDPDPLSSPIKRQRARETGMLTVDRTFAMDSVQTSFAQGKNHIPINYTNLCGGQYVSEMTTPTRCYVVDEKTGRPEFSWTHGNDHSFHADLFDLIAYRLSFASYDNSISISGTPLISVGHRRFVGSAASAGEDMA